MVALPPLLEKRGPALRDRGGGNVELVQYQGLLLKALCWRWPDRNMQGNAIDFFVKVLGRSFAQAMDRIAGQLKPASAVVASSTRYDRFGQSKIGDERKTNRGKHAQHIVWL